MQGREGQNFSENVLGRCIYQTYPRQNLLSTFLTEHSSPASRASEETWDMVSTEGYVFGSTPKF